MLGDRLLALVRHDRLVVIAGLTVACAVAWSYLLLGAGFGGGDMRMPDGSIMSMMPEPSWTPTYSALMLVMWAVMMAAMMLPSAAPIVLLVVAISRKRAAASAPARWTPAAFAIGYLLVWAGFSVVATGLQWALDRAGLLSADMAAGSAILAGGVAVTAGVYQWTPLKQACLRHCRSPLDFLLEHWRPGTWGAVSSGLRHGVFCVGCCWMLMALLFVGGVMHLLWVAALALLVLLEKTLPWGRGMSRVTGAALITWGGLAIAGVL